MFENEPVIEGPVTEIREKADTALVVGKFYPPHLGHKYLIDSASSKAEHLTVLVVDKDEYKIPGELRASWLREIHPDVEVLLREDKLPDDDSERWAENTLSWLGYTPQLVFTSEDYGIPYAKALGADHVSVDRFREHLPISGTRVRQNPLENFDFLEPCVKSYFAKRICVLGAESTGTTTMAKALADTYETVWVPEFGRKYSELKLREHETEWNSEEFAMIAHEQQRREEEMARVANKVLICDTNAFATELWHERYMGSMSPEVNKIGDQSKADLYLVTDVDIPFVQDGTRDGEHIRSWMHQRFIDELKNRSLPFIVLSGTHEERLKRAQDAIDFVVKNSPPIA